MTRYKGWILVGAFAFAGIFVAFSTRHTAEEPLSKDKLLVGICQLLASQHYSPQVMDDAFSKKIFKKYLATLDPNRDMFLRQDIMFLKQFETLLDDEMLGTAPYSFVPAVSKLYKLRQGSISAIYRELLSAPFDFSIKESILRAGAFTDNEDAIGAETDTLRCPADSIEQRNSIRKMLKFYVLERYVDLLDARDKKTDSSLIGKTDEELQKQARERVLKIMNKNEARTKKLASEDAEFNLYVNTIANMMDPHTDYMPPVDKRTFDEEMSGHFYGIGARLTADKMGNVTIAEVLPGGAAWKSKEIMDGDIIMAVGQGELGEFVDVAGYEIFDVVKIMRGDKGAIVRIKFKGATGTTKIVVMKRDEIIVDETFARSFIVKSKNKKIGIIYLPEFYADYVKGVSCAEDVAKEVEKLKSEKVDGIAIDLRYDGGGYLEEVKKMVGYFVGAGPVVQVRDKEGKINVLENKTAKIIYDGPLIVMMNELSASASEIFAAAIQDYKRGVIVGSTTSYGKGTVQRTIPLGKQDIMTARAEYGALKITFQKFYRVSGGATQLRGVTADVVLPDLYEYLKIRERDKPSALPWDEIKKSNITPLTNDFTNAIVIENEKVKKDTAFRTLLEQTAWLKNNMNTPVSLDMERYRQEQKKMREINELSKVATKIKDTMNVFVSTKDTAIFFHNVDKKKVERNKRWLEDQKTDLYVYHIVQILSNIRDSNATTKKGK